VKRFYLNRRVLDISHPPYSPDFVPTVFFSVPRQMNRSSELFDNNKKVTIGLNTVLLEASNDWSVLTATKL
jgi:hypothetical protein